eukprot:6499681-Prymnesium_polylepis.1
MKGRNRIEAWRCRQPRKGDKSLHERNHLGSGRVSCEQRAGGAHTGWATHVPIAKLTTVMVRHKLRAVQES